MTAGKPSDQHTCAKPDAETSEISDREKRTLRTYGVLEATVSRKGGRSRKVTHARESEILHAIEEAKSDPAYKRKLHRAVLIAWVRDAPIGTDGLRWAYREHYKIEERTAWRLIEGQQVREDDPEFPIGPAANRALAAAQVGDKISHGQALGVIADRVGSALQAAASGKGRPRNLPATAEDSSLAVVRRRPDGTFAPLPQGEEIWRLMALAPLRRIARTARREELDAAKELVRPTWWSTLGLTPSDLVVAHSAPQEIQYWREATGDDSGDRWWKQLRR